MESMFLPVAAIPPVESKAFSKMMSSSPLERDRGAGLEGHSDGAG